MFSVDLSTRECDGHVVVALRGELDLADAADVAAALAAAVAREPRIIVDLAGLGFIDCSGVAALARARRRARQAGGDLLLAAPQQRVLRVVAITRLAGEFYVHASVEEAAGSAGRSRREAVPVPGRPSKIRWPRPGVWGLVASQAAGRGGRVSTADVCAAAVAAVEVTGAWLSAARGAEAGHLMRVTDEVSEQLAELHLTLGEGPCLDAAASGGPVLASDLAGGESRRRWPVFALAARQAGAAAIFAFPLRIGAIRAGVLGLYRERPGPLTAFQLGDALIFADTATLLLLDAQDQAGGDDLAVPAGPGGQPADLALRRAEIDQATGMLTEQLGAGIGDAFVRLRAYAYARDLRLTDVARDIVARRLRLHPDPSRDGEA